MATCGREGSADLLSVGRESQERTVTSSRGTVDPTASGVRALRPDHAASESPRDGSAVIDGNGESVGEGESLAEGDGEGGGDGEGDGDG
jgi:hypothetical protein